MKAPRVLDALADDFYTAFGAVRGVWVNLPPVRARIEQRRAGNRQLVLLGRDLERRDLGLPNAGYSEWFAVEAAEQYAGAGGEPPRLQH